MKKQCKSNCILTSAFCLLLAGFLTAFFVTPKVDFSEKEKKVLASPPKLTAQTLTDGGFFSGVDTYISDHFPLREMWVGAAAYGNLLIGRNGAGGVYKGKDGWLIAKPHEENSLQFQQNLHSLQKFREAYGKDIFVMPVPSTGYIMEDVLPASHMEYRDDQVYQALAGLAGIQLIDLRDSLKEAANSGQVYYKTDHHWTSYGAFQAYQSFLNQAFPGTLVDEQNYGVTEIEDFYGTSYAKSGYWMTGADTIELWQNPALEHVHIEITDDDIGSAVEANSVFDFSYENKADKYPVFLGGNHSLVKITNPGAANRKILLVKDSFANAFAPFLAEQYEEVYLIDLRYSRQRSVSAFITENEIDDVLFLYSTDDLVNDNNFVWLK